MLRRLGNRIILMVLLLSLSVPFTVSGQEGDSLITVAVPESDIELMQGAADRFTEQTGIEVEIVPVSDDPDERVPLYQSQHDAGELADVIIAPSYALYLLGMDKTDYSEYDAPDILDSVLESGRINHDNMLLGLPWHTDVSMMYYRTDILEELGVEGFESWEELFEIASSAQEFQRGEGNEDFWGFLWQGSNDMPLAYNAAEWMYSVNGAPYVQSVSSEEVETVVNTAESIGIVEAITGTIDGISPPEVLEHDAAASLEIFQSGNAMFMRNWSFAIDPLQEAEVAFGIAPIPAGGSGVATSTIDGEFLMVNADSGNVDAAVEFVFFLQSEGEQLVRLQEASYIPSSASIYEDYGEDYPYLQDLLPIIEVGQPLPKVEGTEPHLALAQTIYDILTGEVTAEEGLETLAFGWNPCALWPWLC